MIIYSILYCTFINNFDNFLLGKQCLKLPYLKQLSKDAQIIGFRIVAEKNLFLID